MAMMIRSFFLGSHTFRVSNVNWDTNHTPPNAEVFCSDARLEAYAHVAGPEDLLTEHINQIEHCIKDGAKIIGLNNIFADPIASTSTLDGFVKGDCTGWVIDDDRNSELTVVVTVKIEQNEMRRC